MFDIGWGELVVIGIVALIAIGPKELPTVLRTLGQYMGKVRRMASEFQGQFQEAMREAELVELKKQAEDLKSSVSDSAARSVVSATSIRLPTPRSRSRARSTTQPNPNCQSLTRRAPWRQLKPLHLRLSTSRCLSRALPSARKILRPPKRRRPSRPGARHEPRGHRGHQGAIDGSPDRAALAADQGAARIRRDVRNLLRIREGHLQYSGMAVRVGRRARKFQVYLHRAPGIFHYAIEARDVRRGVSVVSRSLRRKFTCLLRLGSIATSARRFCRT